MKPVLACVALCFAVSARAQTMAIEAMPKDAQAAFKQHLSKRVESRLASGGVDPSLAGVAANVKDPRVLQQIEFDFDTVKAAAGGEVDEGLPVAARGRFEQAMKARVKIHALASSGVPDEVLVDVVGMNKRQLLEKAGQNTVDFKLAGQLHNAFPQHGSWLKDPSTIMQYNPMTPIETKNPMLTAKPAPQGTFDPMVNRSTATVDRRGFAVVGVLADISATPFRIICSGTLVSSDWFMTATHCFYDERSEGKVAWEKLGVFLPFQNGTDVLERSSDGKRSKNMLHRAVAGNFSWFGETSNAAFPQVERDVNHQIELGNDVALLPLKSWGGPPLNVGTLSIPVASDVVPPLTLAGYGLSNAKDVVGDLLLEISLRREGFVNDPDGPLLVGPSVPKPDWQGRVCRGDSGGPIFRGKVDGTGGVTLQLVAIASMVQAAADGSADACLDGVQKFTRIDRPAVRQWLCTKANVGC